MSGTYEPSPDAKAETGGKRLDDDALKIMRERYSRGIDRDAKNREAAREDLSFKVGEQWPKAELDRRGDRPALTFNKMLGFIRQVTGDVRQNKPAIKVRPQGEGADKETAEVYAGLIRNIEQQSFAGYIYSQGIDSATSCGQGAWRITTEYTSDDSFEQDILIKSIPNALSVVWDPDAQELDKSDAKWCFVYSSMPKDDFKEQYPKAKAIDFEKLDKGIADQYGDWYTSDNIRTAEYWCKKPVLKTLLLLSDGRVLCKDDYDQKQLEDAMMGATVAQERTVKSQKIYQHIVSGAEELEEPTEWVGRYIPIIHVMGEETWVDERRVTYGLIRHAKDAQRAYNYERSTMIEVTALQPKAPYMLSAAMIEGEEMQKMWANAGAASYPYLLFKSDPNLPNRVPERVQPPVPAAGLLAGAQLSAEDMKGTTGIFDASLGAHSNETSGIAIERRKAEGDVSTFVYIDNGSLAIAYTGRQLVDLIPKVYDTKRVLRVLYDDGTDEQVTVNQTVMDGQGKSKVRHEPAQNFYDLSAGKYDITVEAGPTFSSRRQEAAQGILEMMRAVPTAAPVLGARLAQMQDWPHADEIAEDLDKLLPPQLQKEKTDENGQVIPPPEPPPDPEVVKAQAQLELQKQQAQFEEAKGKADIALKRELAQAEMELEQQKIAAQLEMQRQQFDQQMALEKYKADQQAALEKYKAELAAETKREADKMNAHMNATNMAIKAEQADRAQEHKAAMMDRASAE